MTPGGFALLAGRGFWRLAPHLALLNRKLVELAAGRIRRLIVHAPVRHGKSLLTSQFFPAWYLGAYPRNRLILAAYNDTFAAEWGRRARGLLEEYGPALFGVSVQADSRAADRWEVAGTGGGMTCVGRGGAATGKGGNLIVIDDPVKNDEEAFSEAIRDSTDMWYHGTLYTRQEPGAGILLMMARWHEDDLVGRRLAEMEAGTGERWEYLRLPAIAEEDDPLGRKPGEALWPERYDERALAAIKRALTKKHGAYFWDALYQGRPVPLSGGLVKRGWFRYYRQQEDVYLFDQYSVPLEKMRRYVTVDLAVSLKTSADWTVISTWGAWKRKLLLLDRVRARMEGPDIVPAIKKAVERWKPAFVGIERVAFQLSVVQEARRAGVPVRELLPDKDKLSRLMAATSPLEAGDVYWPRDADWLDEWEGEFLRLHPKGGLWDQVDTYTYAAWILFNWMRYEDDPEPAPAPPAGSANWAKEARERPTIQQLQDRAGRKGIF